MYFFEEKKILFYKKFHFRKKISTTYVITDLLQNIQKALEEKRLASRAFVDLEKAFDKVYYNSLLTELTHYGIGGIENDWFKS